MRIHAHPYLSGMQITNEDGAFCTCTEDVLFARATFLLWLRPYLYNSSYAIGTGGAQFSSLSGQATYLRWWIASSSFQVFQSSQIFHVFICTDALLRDLFFFF